jgi:hypothetical protein
VSLQPFGQVRLLHGAGLTLTPSRKRCFGGRAGGRWSHVGIAVQLIPEGPIYIESAMPGAGTRFEKPEVFFSPEQASDGEVLLMREDKVDAVQGAAKSLLGRPFDDQLELDDGGAKLYCTELVALALRNGQRDPGPSNAVSSIFASEGHCT